MTTSNAARPTDQAHTAHAVDGAGSTPALIDQRYRAIFDAANDAIFLHDLTGRFVEVNALACTRLGYTRDELLTMSVQDIDAPPLPDQFHEKLEALRQLGSAVLETRHVTKDGRVLTIELSARVVEIDGRTLVMSVARDVSERQRQQAELAARNAQIAGLNAMVSERDRLSRELHDGIAQVLAYVSFKARSIADLVGQSRHDEALAGLRELEDAAQASYTDVRTAIFDLRTTASPDFTLIAALSQYVQHYGHEWGIATTLVVADGAPTNFPATAEVHILRIVQEALNNVRKHARARRVTICITGDQSFADICIEDDGVGFDVHAVNGPHYGLATMRERAEQINAVLTVDSTPGAGTQVRLHLPLSEDTPEGISHGAD